LWPAATAVDAAGNLFIADLNGAIRKVVPGGTITTVVRADNAAQNPFTFSRDAVAVPTRSAFHPAGLAFDAAGNLYISDGNNECVRKFSPADGKVTTVVASCDQGVNGAGFAGDGGPATAARLSAPEGLTVDAAGNLYIADAGNYRVRMVAAKTGI